MFIEPVRTLTLSERNSLGMFTSHRTAEAHVISRDLDGLLGQSSLETGSQYIEQSRRGPCVLLNLIRNREIMSPELYASIRIRRGQRHS